MIMVHKHTGMATHTVPAPQDWRRGSLEPLLLQVVFSDTHIPAPTLAPTHTNFTNSLLYLFPECGGGVRLQNWVTKSTVVPITPPPLFPLCGKTATNRKQERFWDSGGIEDTSHWPFESVVLDLDPLNIVKPFGPSSSTSDSQPTESADS